MLELAKVLVLMSTYNGEIYLREQIDSILGQTDCDTDLLVRDDGSTDGTVDILSEYQKKGKLKWYTGENLRPGRSFMNLLINAPEDYDYYAFSDQDDVWKSNKMSAATKMMGLSDKPTLYCGNALLVDHNLESLGHLCNNYILKPNLLGILVGGGIQGATIVINKALKSRFGKEILDADIKMHDYYVSCVCLSMGGRILYDEKPYLLYRQHGDNVVGVNKSLIGTLKKRYEMMTNADGTFDIEKTSKEILKSFDKYISDPEKAILKRTSNYKKHISDKMFILRDSGIGLGRGNIRMALSVGILLGKI